MAALADDSGLVVDALDGRPGVYSARYAGTHGDDAANNAKVLAELEGVPDEQRTGRFVCALAFINEAGDETTVEGTVEGRIGHELRGSEGLATTPCSCPRSLVLNARSLRFPKTRKTPSAIVATRCASCVRSSRSKRGRRPVICS